MMTIRNTFYDNMIQLSTQLGMLSSVRKQLAITNHELTDPAYPC